MKCPYSYEYMKRSILAVSYPTGIYCEITWRHETEVSYKKMSNLIQNFHSFIMSKPVYPPHSVTIQVPDQKLSCRMWYCAAWPEISLTSEVAAVVQTRNCGQNLKKVKKISRRCQFVRYASHKKPLTTELKASRCQRPVPRTWLRPQRDEINSINALATTKQTPCPESVS
jgi:hypothetical protein